MSVHAPIDQRIIGSDPRIKQLLSRVRLVAPTKLAVLVRGESGTGKELFASALHELGARPRGPFVAVNCGALPRELAESELFGHERGAFTGAQGARQGWFEEASGGTLVLDEIGELPLELQPKLLRVLETGRLRRLGARGEIDVDVRVVAMTNRDLRVEAERGRFRLDLYHRLAGFELELPPLRERLADIPALVAGFVAALEPELGPIYVAPTALERMLAYPWPGNVRELRNVVQRAAVLGRPVIDLPALEDALPMGPRLVPRASDAPIESAAVPRDVVALTGKTFEQIEREVFAWALARSQGSRRRAARVLGISRSTFCDRVKRLGIVVEPADEPLALAG